jgi:hypothetical protein
MNPVGLTRAEEAREYALRGPRTVIKAPPGDPGCRATTPAGEACGGAIAARVVWPGPDPDETLVCADCAIRLKMLAVSHRTVLHVDRVSLDDAIQYSG